MHTQTKITPFLRAYIATALWSSTLDDGSPMDKWYWSSDLADETVARMDADCTRFETENAETLTSAIATGQVVCGPDFNEWERAAHDFWLTRNGHGAGFWDGDWPEPYAQRLTDAAEALGSCDLYVGDDGKIYAS
jgi:hypothetical protein